MSLVMKFQWCILYLAWIEQIRQTVLVSGKHFPWWTSTPIVSSVILYISKQTISLLSRDSEQITYLVKSLAHELLLSEHAMSVGSLNLLLTTVFSFLLTHLEDRLVNTPATLSISVLTTFSFTAWNTQTHEIYDKKCINLTNKVYRNYNCS